MEPVRSRSFARLESWEQVEAFFMANALATRPVDNSEQLASLSPKRHTADAARELLRRFELQSRRLSQPTPRSARENDLLKAIHSGNYAALPALGMDVEYAWLHTIAKAIVLGAPFVEIETVGPYAVNHIGADGSLNVSLENMSPDERAGMLIASALRRALHGCSNVRFVYLLDDVTAPSGESQITIDDRDRYVVQMGRIFYGEGVLRHQDVPGHDYVLVRESDAETRLDELIDQVTRSRTGRIDMSDGQVTFRPTEEFVRQLALRSPNRKREFIRRGISLKRNGRPTCHALEAAGFLDSHNRHVLHVIMLDARFAAQQDKTYALLSAAGIVRPDTHHNLFYDADSLGPETVALAVCELLMRDIRRVLADSMGPSTTARSAGTTSVEPRLQALLNDLSARFEAASGRPPHRRDVERGSVFALPRDSYDIVTSFGATEPITSLRREFHVAVRSMVAALRPGGTLVMVRNVMVSDQPAHKGTWHPDIHLTPDVVEEACRAAGLDYELEVVPAPATESTGQATAVLVARRRTW